MKVKEIKALISDLKDDDEVYIGYSDDLDNDFDLYSAEGLIDYANNLAGAEDFDEDERIKDVDYAIQYIAEMDSSYHIME